MLKMHSSFRLYLMHGNLSAVTNSVSILALITFADSSAHVSFTVLSLSQRGIEFSIRWWEDNISTDIIKQYKKEIGMVMVMMMKWDVCSLLLLLQLWTTLKIALAYILHAYKRKTFCANVILEHTKTCNLHMSMRLDKYSMMILKLA